MVTLIIVGEQAVVAGRLTILVGATGPAQISSRFRVEVAEAQRLARHLAQRVWLIEQTMQHARAAFGSLVEEQQATCFFIGQWLCSQFVIFQLITYLDGA